MTGRARPRFRVSSSLYLGVAGACAFILCVQVWTATSGISPDFLPRATMVGGRIVDLLLTPSFRGDIASTLLGWASGLGLAIVIGVPLGIAFGSSPLVYRASSTVVEMMRATPGVALIPLAILVLGQGLAMKAALVAYATIWPILYNTEYGVHDVDPIAKQTARAFGLPPYAVLRYVILPSAAPFTFTGIRVAASIGLIVVVGAELLAGTGTGIGAYILNASANGGQMDFVMAGAVIAGLLGVLVNFVFEAIERRLFAWRQTVLLDA
ncbi:MAG TPA: ABC transporter permease [Candidatus Lustribacter sp.]